MLESLFNSRASNPGYLFLIDWREGASPVKEQISKTSWSLSGTGSVVNDATLGYCYSGNGGGTWYQAGAYNIMDFSITNWELDIDLIPTSNWDGMIMTRAQASNGGGGWYLGMTSARNGLIEFYWQNASNTWQVITSNVAMPLNVVTKLRLVKTGTDIKMFFGNTQVASATGRATFNNPLILLSVAGFADSYSSRRWIGKIGTIKFFVPTV